MADLFKRDQSVIARHIKNIYKEEELSKEGTYENLHIWVMMGFNFHLFNKAHDRFLLIDSEVYHIGASLKDLGKKWFAFTLMRDITTEELLQKI